MDVSELLVSATNYLQEVAEDTAWDDDPIQISEPLLQEIKAASNDVKNELERQSTASRSLVMVAYFQLCSHRITNKVFDFQHPQSIQRPSQHPLPVTFCIHSSWICQFWPLLDLHLRFPNQHVAKIQRWICH